MNLLDVLKEECVKPGIVPENKVAFLDTIATLAKQCSILDNIEHQTIKDALIEREELGSTGFGNGVAIPHCRLPEVKDFVVGLVTIPEGVEFDAMDGNPVKFAVFIIGPECGSNQHIKILSTISQTLNIPGTFEEVMAATCPETLVESFLRNSRDDESSKEKNNKNLFRLVIRNEDLFHEVLKVINGFASSSVVVAEAEPASNYLSKMPLFAGFWTDTKVEFCKVIHATVEKKYTNETIRRIEQQIGSIDTRDDILLMVHELFYCSGELNL